MGLNFPLRVTKEYLSCNDEVKKAELLMVWTLKL